MHFILRSIYRLAFAPYSSPSGTVEELSSFSQTILKLDFGGRNHREGTRREEREREGRTVGEGDEDF